MTAKRAKYLSVDAMFSEVMARKAYKLTIQDLLLKESPDSVAEIFRPLRDDNVFCYAKVSVDALQAMRFLADQSFFLVDTSTTFDKQFNPHQSLTGQATIRFATSEDAAQTMAVAEKSFRYSRFHQDPLVSDEIAHRIKGVWAGNYFRGERGNAMVLGIVDNVVAGFLQLLYKEDTLIIDLIAVAPEYQRRGIARDMIAYAEGHCPPHKMVKVTTQLVNLPSMRFYESLGFRICGAQHIFHYHHPAAWHRI